MTKKFNIPKLALELIGYLTTSIIIASFSFCFLYFISISIGEKAIDNGFYASSIISDPEFTYWLQLICILAAIIIFLTFFLLFLGQKISYILSITKAIQILKEGDLSFKVDSIGNDELTDLADTINSFSRALQIHRENEENLKKEKDSLIRSLSHDIRTPLTAIISYSDFIKNEKYDSTEKLNNYIEIIQNKAYQIQDLSTLLLNPNETYNKLSDNSLLDGKLLFEQFINEFIDALEDNGFNIDLDKLGLVNFKTKVNVQDMSRIFDNLYSNILKYADNHEKISLKIFLIDGNIIFIQRNTIKERFNNNIESNGIGLKNIKQIVNAYNGDVNYIISNKIYTIEIKMPINL